MPAHSALSLMSGIDPKLPLDSLSYSPDAVPTGERLFLIVMMPPRARTRTLAPKSDFRDLLTVVTMNIGNIGLQIVPNRDRVSPPRS